VNKKGRVTILDRINFQRFSTNFMKNSKVSKSILFLSELDFKEKSIQVIRKTPEAYVNAGWDVTYVLSRDSSKYGNYFYENIINPVGVNTIRFEIPLKGLRDKISNHTLRTVITKISGYLTILKLAYIGNDILKTKDIDIIYGYESKGILAINILKLFGKLKGLKIVSRFQGTSVIVIIKAKQYLKRILRWDNFLALKLSSDLCIMTNDGTQGDQVLRHLNSKNQKNLKFWVNGVDEQKLACEEIKKIKATMNLTDQIVLLTICRLETWKRVDRGINVIELLKSKFKHKNIKYYIVGDGTQKQYLESLVKEKKLDDMVIFTGGVENIGIKKYLNIADICISTYDLSNVGNPLLEAIRANKIIFTLNNGDTSHWIRHKENGFIYDIDDNLYENMAKDIHEVMNNKDLKNMVLKHIKITENDMLWTWDERMHAEIMAVEKLLN
jgi:glycosyltransferase involved in cell wall biosynthesis